MSNSTQLALQVGLRDESTLENFFPRVSLQALLSTMASPLEEPLSFLHGPTEVGKSHLLQALCLAQANAIYLPMEQLHELPGQGVFESLENAPLVAIDDLQCLAGDPDWEESLFHFVNRARASGCALWMAADKPPLALPLDLPDLQSRLAGGMVWAVGECTDDELADILSFRAKRRGLDLQSAAATYLCRRESRTLSSLLDTLDRLDEASLRFQRPVSVPFIKEVMGW
ncbi:MAG: DnaA regulatory inactivator Hda [Congregibacter sp.]